MANKREQVDVLRAIWNLEVDQATALTKKVVNLGGAGNNGAPNRGGGGGGAAANVGGGNGGSGVVIVRWAE